MSATIKIKSSIGLATDQGSARYAINSTLVGHGIATATDGRIAAVVWAETLGEPDLAVAIPSEIGPKSEVDSRSTYSINGDRWNVSKQKPKQTAKVSAVSPVGRWPRVDQVLPTFDKLDEFTTVTLDAAKLLQVAKAINDATTKMDDQGYVTLLIPKVVGRAIGVVCNSVSRGTTQGIGVIMPVPCDNKDSKRSAEQCHEDCREYFMNRVDSVKEPLRHLVERWNASQNDRPVV